MFNFVSQKQHNADLEATVGALLRAQQRVEDLERRARQTEERLENALDTLLRNIATLDNVVGTLTDIRTKLLDTSETVAGHQGRLFAYRARISRLEETVGGYVISPKVLDTHELMLAAAVELALTWAPPAEKAKLLDFLSRCRASLIPTPAAPAPAPISPEEVAAVLEQFEPVPMSPQETTTTAEDTPAE